jgi:hypothetical protein
LLCPKIRCRGACCASVAAPVTTRRQDDRRRRWGEEREHAAFCYRPISLPRSNAVKGYSGHSGTYFGDASMDRNMSEKLYGTDWFYRYIKNRLLKFNFFKKFEKKSKKARVYFKIFGENQI